MPYPTVTEVISFCNSRAFDNVPALLLEIAAERGTRVHSEIAMTLLDLWFEPDPTIAGYLQSFNLWRQRTVAEVIAVEPELISHKYHVVGHADAVVRLHGDHGLTLCDWKTPAVLSKSWRVQLAGYWLLAKELYHLPILRVASVQPRPDGREAKFTGYSKTLRADANVFISGVNWWNFFNKAA